MGTGSITIPTDEYTDIDVVRTFMREVDVVDSVRKLDSIKDYLELLELFYTDGEKKLAMLPELRESKDIARYTIEVHGLKSAAANIGAAQLSALAKEHEDAGKAEKSDWIDANAAPLEAKIEGTLAEIKRVLKTWGFDDFADKDVADLLPIEESEAKEKIEKAIEALEDFEPKEAANIVDELLGYAVSENVREGLSKARSLLKVYEDDQAEEVLRGLV